MKKASQLLTNEEKEKILEAIAESEKNTTGEIVPVIASSSGRYDRSEDIVGVFSSIFLVSVVWFLVQGISSNPSHWDGLSLNLGLGWIILFMFIGFLLGSTIATYFPILKLPFVLNSEINDEIQQRVSESFYRFGVRRTSGATGILIYISLLEKKVVIQGDTAISEKLQQEDWDHICQTIIQGMKNNQPAVGIRAGILQCGDLLKQYFPADPSSINQLKNSLYFIDS